jgi:hypothetical protein
VLRGQLITVDDYSGATVLLLAIVGALSLGRVGKPRPVVVFALASVLVWGAKLYGAPGVNELGRLPLLVQTLIYIFGTPLLSFSLVLLCAAGVQVVLTHRIGFKTALAAACVFAGYAVFASLLNRPALEQAGLRHALSTLGLAVVAGGAVLLCVALLPRWSMRLAAVAAGAVAIAELAILAPRGVYSDRYDSLVQPPYVSWLQQQQSAGQPFRVFSNDGLLYPDYASAFGLDDPRDVDGQYPRRAWDFVHTFLSPSTFDRLVGGFGHPELPTETFANKWLNLSNVRFILRPPDQSPADASLGQVIVAANFPPTDSMHLTQLTIDGQRRESLIERTPGDVTYRFRPDAERPKLSFLIGLDPNADPNLAEQFTLSIRDSGGQPQILFDQVLDSSSADGRRWTPGAVDLSAYAGRDVELLLQTRSVKGPPTSAPAWGDLQLEPRPDTSQYTRVYQGEVSIWENNQVAPRAFLVANVQPASTSNDAIAQMQAPEFDPLTAAVVEGNVRLDGATSPPGIAQITSESQQQVQIVVHAQQPALLVLTDTYYPGWTAAIDGEPAPILPTDVAFRGLVVPPGEHMVIFHFAPTSFRIGLAIAAGALVLLGLLMWRLPVSRPVQD